MSAIHVPVMATEVATMLACRDGGTYVDATSGSGGHGLCLLQRYPGIARLIAIDCDREAVQRSRAALSAFGEKAMVLHGNFKNLRGLLSSIGVQAIDGILFDLGVSTQQLKSSHRGFGFTTDASLDMRMDLSIPVTACDLLARWTEQELADVLHRYGQERWARRIARHIVRERERTPITTTTQLAQLVIEAIPWHRRSDTIHPATRTFQAIRIAVNDELNNLDQGLDAAHEVLMPGGRICVLSFHSLEDGLVKKKFRAWERGCQCPAGVPVCVCGGMPKVRILTRKPLRPSAHEVADNPRSRSARLRAAEKVA
ncbi:MAG: 16S rRNA (cytosine(1402)-N(4))-methyltransferase RsmH [Desulfobacterota bacterium]|nr:16S rRNA (cytosine(1402)-N(4))-methyltransferase RsmH [Thermodesulfobacteriota bacterium]